MGSAPVVAGMSLVALGPADAERLADFCRRATDFFELVEGKPGGPETAADILGPLPPHVTSGTHYTFGVERGGELIGLLDALEGYPAPEAWYVGLLVLVPGERRAGLGSRIWLATHDWIRARGGTLVRILVQQQNTPGRAFWDRQGFSVETELAVKVGLRESPCWRMQIRVARDRE